MVTGRIFKVIGASLQNTCPTLEESSEEMSPRLPKYPLSGIGEGLGRTPLCEANAIPPRISKEESSVPFIKSYCITQYRKHSADVEGWTGVEPEARDRATVCKVYCYNKLLLYAISQNIKKLTHT